MIALRRRVAHLRYAGRADQACGAAVTLDSIVRIYSMTKSLTSVAAMMLYAQVCFQLDGPITRALPCFHDMRVFTGGGRGTLDNVPAERDITFRDALTRASELTVPGRP